MAKVHRYASRIAWKKNSRAFGRNFVDTAQFVAAEIVVIAFLAFWPGMPLAVRTGFIGLSAGAVGVLIIVFAARLDDPQMLGNLAEVWTAETFRQVKGWRAVHNIATQGGDIDHVVITPAGVLAVETKFHRYVDQQRRDRDLAEARRAKTRTEALLRSERVPVMPAITPVLIVWGKGRPIWSEGYRVIDDVCVVDGDHPALWTHLFAAPLLTVEMREEVFSALSARQLKHADRGLPPLGAECWAEFREGFRQYRAERAERSARRHALRSRHRLERRPALERQG